MKRLFFDLETSPCIGFFWKPGYKLSIGHDNIISENAVICASYKWQDEKKVHTLTWDKGDDKKLFEKFLPIVEKADEIVAHNGDRYDVPWINTRALKHGLGPVPIWKTVDTLAIARKRFRFNSNRLDYIGKFLFGEGKIETGFGLWKDIVMNNCPKSMKKMVKYCEKDVLLLQSVWEEIEKYHNVKSHAGVLAGKPRWTCPHCGSVNVSKSKTRTTAGGGIQHQMKCKDCGSYYTISNTVFKKYLEEK